MSPRRDSESENPSTNGGRKPFTRPNSAQRGAREALSRRLSAGDPRSEQSPRRRIPVGLSTSSVFPSGVEEAFRLAAEIGYDGMEVMVSYPAATACRSSPSTPRRCSSCRGCGVATPG